MKKILFLTMLFMMVFSVVTYASPNADEMVIEPNSIAGIQNVENYVGPSSLLPPDPGSIAGINSKDIIPLQRGCCSHHRGVCGCDGGRQVCCDGSYSPSCGC